MRTPRIVLAGASALVLLSATACGEPGSSGGGDGAPGGGTSTLAVCAPIAGEQLVVLDDDQNLQTVDNIIPALNAAAAEEPMLAALDAVSAALDTDVLVDLNKRVDIDRNTSSQVAAAFLEENDLGIAAGSGSGDVVVGAGNFSESTTLAELYAAALREAGYAASVRSIGNRETYLPALESGELTVVPEYVGTLTEFLNKAANGPDAEPLASGDLGLGEDAGLVFGEPSAAADQNAFAVTVAFAEEHDLTTLSDLAAACGGIVLGGPPECPDRPFCQPGLEETYGLDIAEFTSLDAGGPLTKAALRQGQIALGLVFSSDAAFADAG
jgi:osmoprotectant transport system substrate-binding protein